ncbi:class I tRNA ligase family protein [Patescibacteria group bacterium]
MSKKEGKRYKHKKVEKHWREKWKKEGVYKPDINDASSKFYNLWMFPYPSAEGLHAGHAFASTGSDVIGRFTRMSGKNVFQPMVGYDSFGIHAENYAIKINEHPMKMLRRVTENYGKQMLTLGHGYDWTRSVTTSDINYYKWTQWLFRELFKAGLAYRNKASVNWCSSCKTVLADEQVMTPAQAGKEPKDEKGKKVKVTEGLMVCERCGTVVEKKELKQWFLRITDYADKLLDNLKKINWPEKIKIVQTNWIGKKEGINIEYPIKDHKETIKVWTSRPDTNFGATFIVSSPEYAKEHLLPLIKKEEKEKVTEYINISLNKSKDDRIAEGREKTGVFTGLLAVNQLNDYEMPIWITDFVLADVGTGCVVGVPGHDSRDFDFAKKFDLDVKRVVVASDGDTSEINSVEQVQEEEGRMVNSKFLDGLDINKATQKIMDYLEDKGWGERTTNYHLRDWLVSRQRYWGGSNSYDLL